MSTNTGGPAFPTKRRVQRAGYLTDEYEPMGGMTLRDYFAAKAMQALIEKYDESPVEISLEAYEIADAMLKEREASNA